MDYYSVVFGYSTDYITFAAHVDYQQSSEFVLSLKPSHLVSSCFLMIM